MRISPDGGRTFPRWWSGPGRRKRELPLARRLPTEPVTVPTYDPVSRTGRLLVCDFDVELARTGRDVTDPVRRVELDAASFVALIERLGGRAIMDRSPSDGRHVYVLFAQALPFADLRDAVHALAHRYVSLDTSPMNSVYGQIRIPGSPHKMRNGALTGWMTLITPLEEADRIARTPCGPQVWNRLVQELAAEYASAGLGAFPPVADWAALRDLPHDTDGMPWLPRHGGSRPLRADFEEIAVTGAYDGGRYRSGSEARQAILTSCAARGWRLEEVTNRIESGQWGGLATLYSKYRRRRTALHRDWKKALTKITPVKRGRNVNTSRPLSRPPAPGGDRVLPQGETAVRNGANWHLPVQSKVNRRLSPWQTILTWQNAVWAAERDPDLRQEWGRQAISIRKVLRALGVASQMSGSPTSKFGCRYLSLLAGLDYTTVSRVLRTLREADDPLIDQVAEHHHDEPDVYCLRIPDRYRHMAMWRNWRAGLITAIHPVFTKLQAPAAFVYEALSESAPTASGELSTLAAISRTATTDALRELAGHGLAERVPGPDGGWRRGPHSPDTVAHTLGADLDHAERTALYAEHRRQWRELLASFKATPTVPPYDDGLPTDPQPGLAAERADHLAQHEPPPDLDAHVGADHLSADTNPAAPHAPPTPTDTAADWTDLRPASPAKDKSPPAHSRRQPTPRSARPTRLDDAQAAQLLADSPQLRLLSEELGAVVLAVVHTAPDRAASNPAFSTGRPRA